MGMGEVSESSAAAGPGWVRNGRWHCSPRCRLLAPIGGPDERRIAAHARADGAEACPQCCSPERIAWFAHRPTGDLPKLVPTPAEVMVLLAWWLGCGGHVLCCDVQATLGTLGPWYSIDAATWEDRYGPGYRRRVELAMANGGG